MKKVTIFLLGWLLIINLIDAGTTYYAFHNNLDVAEVGLLKTADGVATNLAISVHFNFSLLMMGFCFWLVSLAKVNRKSLLFKLLIFMIFIWAILDTIVAVNNILVILKAT